MKSVNTDYITVTPKSVFSSVVRGGSSVSLSPLAPTLQRIDADTVAHERLIVETRLAKSAIDIKHLVRIRVPRDGASAVTTGRSQSDAWRMLCVHNPGYTQP